MWIDAIHIQPEAQAIIFIVRKPPAVHVSHSFWCCHVPVLWSSIGWLMQESRHLACNSPQHANSQLAPGLCAMCIKLSACAAEVKAHFYWRLRGKSRCLGEYGRTGPCFYFSAASDRCSYVRLALVWDVCGCRLDNPTQVESQPHRLRCIVPHSTVLVV